MGFQFMSEPMHPLLQILRAKEKAKAEGRRFSFSYHAEKGVSAWIGKQPKGKQRRCGALCRNGEPCKLRVVEGKRRCRLHGGLSTGPKTPEGRERIAQANRQRAATRAANRALLIERGRAIAEEIARRGYSI